MSETTHTYPRLPLSEVPGYDPGGPVMVEWAADDRAVWLGDSRIGYLTGWSPLHRTPVVGERATAALILDPTGAASLARAVAARVGLDVSGGVTFGGGLLAFCVNTADGEGRCWRRDDPAAPAGLADATDTLSALAIVARAVLT